MEYGEKDDFLCACEYGRDDPITSVFSKEDLVRNVLMNLGFKGSGNDEKYYFKQNKFEKVMVRLGEKPKIVREVAGKRVLNEEFGTLEEIISYLQEELTQEFDTAKFWDLALNQK